MRKLHTDKDGRVTSYEPKELLSEAKMFLIAVIIAVSMLGTLIYFLEQYAREDRT